MKVPVMGETNYISEVGKVLNKHGLRVINLQIESFLRKGFKR